MVVEPVEVAELVVELVEAAEHVVPLNEYPLMHPEQFAPAKGAPQSHPNVALQVPCPLHVTFSSHPLREH